MEKKIIYVADDGTEFEDDRECLAHERRLQVDAFGDHLRLWDENMKPLDPTEEDALTDAYFIYADTPEAREWVEAELDIYCKNADFVFNLAGVNRPQDPKEFMEGNFGFASTLLNTLKKYGNTCPVMISSSIQAELDNPYGESKRAGEQLMFDYYAETGAKGPFLILILTLFSLEFIFNLIVSPVIVRVLRALKDKNLLDLETGNV